MKTINLEENITITKISGSAFILKDDGSLSPLNTGMTINSGTIIVLTDNGAISATNEAGVPAELSYELVQDIPLPTTYEHIFSTRDNGVIQNGEDLHHTLGHKTASNIDVQKIHDAILDGIDPTKVQQATAAGNESSSNWGVVTIDYDNDKMLAKAGFDTAYQPSSVKYPQDYSGQEAHQDIKASITIDSISQDDVVTAAESHSKQTITGTVGDDVKAGDIVTVTLDGKTLGTATVENHDGKLTWLLDVDGKTLLQSGTDKVSASVTTTDAAGNTATADTAHDYSIDVKASIAINPITDDNQITQAEGHEKTLPITGTVGDDVQAGDKVVVTVNGHDYNTTVTADKTWSVNVTGDDILHADKATATVTTDYGIPHEATATTSEHYDVQIDAGIQITSIAGDDVVNKTESEGKVPVTGTVGKDVEPGDTVTVTIGDKTYTTTVTADKTWTVDVDGSALVNNKGHDVHASVTANDGAGHSTTANDDKPYTVDTEIKASIVIDAISQDDVVTAAESHSKQTITGTVGDDVKAGDIVTVTLDGKTLGTATVENHDGKLTWSLDVDGKTLLQSGTDKVSASVTTTDAAGNTATANTTHDYSIDVKASITINPITGDNQITQAEGHEKTLPITGTVGDDVQAGDKVVVTVNGHKYNTTVTADKTWSVNVTGDDILHADKATATVTTDYGIPHEATATTSEHYDVQIDASIKITSIAGDDVVNKTESEGKVPVTGTVGKDVEPGDTVTVTIGDKTYTTTVTADKTWTVDVDGSALVNNKGHDVHASVTANDGAGHSTTANDDKPYTVDTDIKASITIDSISQDDMVTAAESHSKQTITGTVGDDVKAGDIVTVTLDGKTLGTATVENHDGKLIWSLDVDGKTLLQSGTDKVSASVTTTDAAGNTATANTAHDYSIDVKASITINPITGDNQITQAEGHEKTLPITGTVGDDVQAGDKVVVTVNGHDYNTTVTADKTWSVNVTGDDILHADKATATVTTDYGIPNEATATTSEHYDVQIDAGIQIISIAGDDVVNKAESEGKVPVTGTVGKDVEPGDTVTITIGDKTYTTTVTADKTWTVDVDGSALVNNKGHDVHASVTANDGAGHTTTASDDKPYTVDTEIKASIVIDAISQDDVVTAAESHSKQTITGTVGDDVKAGDIVTVTLDGKTLGTATVENHDGKLIWSLDVDGKTLLQSGTDKVSASVTTTDAAGNTATADTTHDYSIDVKASITINPITGDNQITQAEGHEKTLPITGTVGDDVQAGDKVVVTVNGHDYNTTVTADKTWSVNVTGDDILHADKATATVTTDYGIPHEATATTSEHYDVQIDAGIQITSIAGDDVVNKTESEGKVPVTGTVGKDVEPGDTVTVTIGDKTYTTTVTADKTWTVNVDGSALVNNKGHDVHASVTANDGAGHEATATNNMPYTVDTEINATITIDNVTTDNVINEAEAKEIIPLHGTVGGDVKAGDDVTINVDGHEYKTNVVELNGKLGWTVDVEGSVLANASKDHITAQVTATDNAGNSKTASAEHDYSVKTLDASITIDDITSDNVINEKEATEKQLLHGDVGGDVKVGDNVTITLDGHDYTTKVIERNGKLGWQLEVAGSVLANVTADQISASVSISDNAGNSETATATHDYKVATLDVSVTVDTINGGKAITGEEHDNNTPITVTGSVGGDAKVGDTVTLHFGDQSVDVKVEDHGAGKLGYTAHVPGGYFEPNQNNGFTGEVNATISISDSYGNDALADAQKDYNANGHVVIGTPSSDVIDGTGYNDVLIGDSAVEQPDVDVNLVLDVSGSMAGFIIEPDSLKIEHNYTSGTIGYFDGHNQYQVIQDFHSKEDVIKYFENTGSLGFLEKIVPATTLRLPDGSFQTFKYSDLVTHTKIDQAKDSVREIAQHYGEVLDHDQLSNMTFTVITFAVNIQKNIKFHWDFNSHQFVDDQGVNLDTMLQSVKAYGATNDFNTAIAQGIDSFNDTSSTNVLYFVSDGLDGSTDLNKIKELSGDGLDKYDPIIVSTLIGSDVTNTVPKEVSDITSLGEGYLSNNDGTSKVLLVKDISKLGDELNNSFDNILAGNDTIHGGAGNDIIVGDTLNNTWLLEQYGSDIDHLSDLISHGTSVQDILYSVVAKDANVSLEQLTTHDVFDFMEKNQQSLILDNHSVDGGIDKLFGDAGDDVIFGDSGSDILTGGTGNDLLFGQQGNDILISDAGSDHLWGGEGADEFKLDVLKTDEKTVTEIKDFSADDKINLDSILGKDTTLDNLLSKVSDAKIDNGNLDISFDKGKHHVIVNDISATYHDLGTSTNDIISHLYQHNAFSDTH
ncbi:retention module-containing protein [Photobacterium leiognathi]|uniref:retention module-containing protein n=1 Tax=Photobacterium leiognathi TaxID=553611 RepID=UPI0029829218|nr:retention module-containing protein [Photobacterium leiognathi]